MAQREFPETAAPTRLAKILHGQIDTARRTGEDQRVRLAGGAMVIARVRDGLVSITVKRAGVMVGTVELKTFCRDAGVPADAQRIPAEGQNEREGWHFVTFRWRDAAKKGANG